VKSDALILIAVLRVLELDMAAVEGGPHKVNRGSDELLKRVFSSFSTSEVTLLEREE
jgi:hypothetical protein